MTVPTGHPSTSAIAGHPVHPMVVPLPIGGTVLAFLSDMQAARSGDAGHARRSHWLLGLAVLGGFLATPSGSIDALTIRAARESPVTWAHATGNLALVAIGALEWLRRRRIPMTAANVSPSVTALMVGGLLVTGWLGGELAYRKGIGMNLLDAEPTPRMPGGHLPAEGRRDIADT